MTAGDLLARLRERGVTVEIRGDGRVWLQPVSALSAEELAIARAHRAEIVKLLTAAPEADDDAATPTAWPRPMCSSCSTTTATVFMEMVAGLDGQPWWLCGGCWGAS